MKNLLLLFLLFFSHLAHAVDHPHVLVNQADRQRILNKIESNAWARRCYQSLLEEIRPYVQRHQKDPQWILSRYQMNWESGKYYTRFLAESRKLIYRSCNAPVPTIKVSSAKRRPLDPEGYAYKMPKIEDLIPYDTRDSMYLQSTGPAGQWDWVDPGALIGSINGSINELALTSAFLYWLTDKEAFGKFAEDILLQWARGARYNEPVEGSQVLGFLTFQTLNDASYRSLPLIYDFLYDRLTDRTADLENIQIAFQKLARIQLERGYTSNNWYAAEMPTMLFTGLTLENEDLRQQYLQYFLTEDYGTERIGQKSLRYTIDHWLTVDGHWKEPPAYHNYPVVNIMLAALAAEKNDVEVFRTYPALFKASYVMSDYVFPNGMALGFGDNHHRVSQNALLLELALTMSMQYNHPDKDRIAAELQKLIKAGYDRSESGLYGLLFYVDSIPEITRTPTPYPVTTTLEFAQCYIQRLGEDPYSGMMYAVQGGTYNHNHANGIAMELYGEGYVLGADPGADITYETDKHREYYSMYAAHNTVVAAGKSGPTGPGFTKHMGAIDLEMVEPPLRKAGVSERCAFSLVTYTEPSTGTKQERLMAIVKTSPETGYYVDLFRSDNPVKNEYIYHNIGHKMLIRTTAGKSILMRPTAELDEDYGEFGPGYKYFTNKKASGLYEGNVLTTFILNESSEMVWMNVHSLGNTDREYFSALAPRTHTAPPPINTLPTPTLVIRQTGEAWTRPFVNIFEASRDHGQNYNVKAIRPFDPYTGENGKLAFEVTSEIEGLSYRQHIFRSDSANMAIRTADSHFEGSFGIVGYREGSLDFLYIGQGIAISSAFVHARFISGNAGALYLEQQENGYRYSATEPVSVSLTFPVPAASVKKPAELRVSGKAPVKAHILGSGKGNHHILVQAILPAGTEHTLEIGSK